MSEENIGFDEIPGEAEQGHPDIKNDIKVKDIPVARIVGGGGPLYEEFGTGIRLTPQDFARIHGYKNEAELNKAFASHSRAEGGNL